MDDGDKDVALALLLGWSAPNPLAQYWSRPANSQDQPSPDKRVWVFPPYRSHIHPSWTTRTLHALSANAAVWYDTK